MSRTAPVQQRRRTPVFCISDFWFPKFGGMERSIDNLCRGLPRAFEPQVFTPDVGGEAAASFGYNVVRLPSVPSRGYYDEALLRIRAAPRPRIVHVFGFSYSWPGPQARFVAAAAALPDTFLVVKVPTQGDARRYLESTHAGIVGVVSRFVALTTALRDELFECGVRSCQVTLVPNGVSTGRFTPARAGARREARAALGLPDDRPLFGFCGRFERRKRIDLLVSAVNSVAGRPRPLLILAGETDHTFGAGMDAGGFAGPNVRLLAPLGDMRTFYHALDAYVTASCAEGMSNAILEAMASGLPVVASDIPGHRELVHHGQNGLLVQDCAGDGLRNAFEKTAALWRRNKLGAWARASRRIAVAEYDMKKVCRRYAGIYRELAASPGKEAIPERTSKCRK